MELQVWETDKDLTSDEEFEFLDYLGQCAGSHFTGIAYLINDFGSEQFLAIWYPYHIEESVEFARLTEIGEWIHGFNPSTKFEVVEG